MFKKVINAVKRCYNAVKEVFTPTRALVGTSLMVLAGSAQAAVDAAITTAITTAGTDVGTVGGAVFAVLVAAAAFKWLRKAL